MADADFTYDFSKLGMLVEPVAAGEADMVLGQRLDAATMRSMPFLHRFVGTPALSFLVRRACGELPVSDSQSGFRAFRRDAIEALGLRSAGMELASEMLIRAAGAGLRVSEVPTGYRERIGESKLNTFSDGWRHLHLIVMLAPQLLLVWPGAVLFALGAILTAWSLADPTGIGIGSASWQPVFFQSIALVLGAQALLAGVVLANRSPVVSRKVRRQFEFVESAKFGRLCLLGGMIASATGLAIDVALFVFYRIEGQGGLSRALPLASLAQSLLILGVTFAAFAIVFGILARGAGVGIDLESADQRVPELVVAPVPVSALGANDSIERGGLTAR
jgi:hypothetical protein